MHPHNPSKAQTPSTDYLQKCNHDDFKDFFHKKFKELTKNFPKIKPSRLPNVHDWLGIPSAQPDAMLVDILPLWESCQPNLSCCKKSTEKRQRTRKKETQNESPNIPKRKRRRPAGLDIEDALNILTEKLIKSINKPLSCKLKSSENRSITQKYTPLSPESQIPNHSAPSNKKKKIVQKSLMTPQEPTPLRSTLIESQIPSDPICINKDWIYADIEQSSQQWI